MLEYVMPVLYSFILVSLDNIQDHLEHPFDEVVKTYIGSMKMS